MNIEMLSKSLQTNVKSFYMINGNDLFFKKQAINSFKSIVDEGTFDFNISYLNTAVTAEAFYINLQTPPFMSDYRVIFLSADGKKMEKDKAKAFEDKIKLWLKDPCPNVVLVADNDEDYFKFLAKYAEQIDCKKQNTINLVEQVSKMIANHGYVANDAAIKEIIVKCNNDMMIIANELDKLYAYCEDKNITFDIVSQIVVNNIEQSVFKLTDSIAQGNCGEAYSIMDNLLSSGEQPLKILAAISAQYRRMFICKVSALSSEQLAVQLGVKPFAVEIAKKIAKNYKPMQLKKLVDKFQLIEFQTKNGEIGMLEGLNLAFTYAVNRR